MKIQILLTAFLLIGAIVMAVFGGCENPFVVRPVSDELKQAASWSAEQPGRGSKVLPFSFTYDGKPSSELLAAWPSKIETKRLDSARTQRTTVWADSATGLEVRCVSVKYSDFPVVEWTVYFRNAGDKNTPILENIQGIDTTFHRGEDGEFILRGIKGDFCSPASYEPYELTLAPGDKQRFAPPGGRPTDGEFPYYNLQIPGGGIMFTVGWPGQWASSFIRDADTGLHITAGQELTHLYLKPGEEVRTPLIAMLFYTGDDVARSQNLWRRWMLAHNLPKQPDGKPLEPIFPHGGNKKTVDIMAREKIPVDYLWIDAGSRWYPCGDDWWNTGTWEVDRNRYPNGMRARSDHARANGMGFILWFEPERVRMGTWLYEKHPEWLVSNGDQTKILKMGPRLLTNPRDGLLNLADEKVCDWLIERIDGLIKSEGVDFYRSDFNTDPLGWWRGADAPDRQGISENFYVQGYLRYWDELLRRNPGLRIDTCASGGRRNDLETLRRSVPLLRSDYQGSDRDIHRAGGNQMHTYGLSFWLPFYGTGVGFSQSEHSVYGVRSYMCPSLVIGSRDFSKPDFDWVMYKRLVDQWRQVAGCMLGDYYPLTPYNPVINQWVAWQFNRPERGDGMLQAFRRPKCPIAEITVKLRGLDPQAQYIVTDLDAETPKKMTGNELMEQGLRIERKTQPGSAIIKYHLAK